MYLSKKVFLPFILVLAIASCKKDTNETIDFHEDYFPLEEGHYNIYSVREVAVDEEVNVNDTTDYFLKTIIAEEIIDNEGRTARVFRRFKSQSASGPWVVSDLWTTIKDGNRVELVEENQRTIKLVLAPDKFKEWNANAYNMLGELNCYYDNLHDPGSINNFQFDSTVTVEQQDYRTLIDFRRKYEKYAKGVGMYYKHFKDYRINNFDTLHPVQGREIIMRLVDYGTE